jgi:hypothetical protein
VATGVEAVANAVLGGEFDRVVLVPSVPFASDAPVTVARTSEAA